MPSPRALQFRDRDGRVLGTAWGGTTCLNPRPLSKYAAVSEDGEQEHCIPCRDCAGCREFLRRELCKALDTHFASITGELWLVIVEAPSLLHAGLSYRIRRVCGEGFEPGFYRLGDSMFALIARGRSPRLSAWSTRSGVAVSMRRVQRGRGKRAWNLLTWGILTPRATYGANLNRYYHRGLPRFERQKWIVRMRGGMTSRHPWAGRGIIALRGGVGLYRGDEVTLPPLAKRERPLSRTRSASQSVGAVLLGMMDRNYAPVPEPGMPINRRSPKASVPSSVSGFWNAPASQTEDPQAALSRLVGRGLLSPAPTATQKPDIYSVNGRRYATSLHSSTADLLAWGQRMAEKARQRGG